MKKLFLIQIFAICLFVFHSSSIHAQPDSVLKVSYVSGYLSPSMTSVLREKVPSEEQFQLLVDNISQYKIFYDLYIDIKSHVSVFLVDSVVSKPGVSVTGQVEYTYAEADGSFRGEEIFMGERATFGGMTKFFKWDIESEISDLHGKKCRKAKLSDYPYVTVWFTQDIPVSKGPAYYLGLPGLVVSAIDFYMTYELCEIEFVKLTPEIETLFKDYAVDSHLEYDIVDLLNAKDRVSASLK